MWTETIRIARIVSAFHVGEAESVSKYYVCEYIQVRTRNEWMDVSAHGFEKNRKNLRLHFIEFVAFETVNSSEDVNVSRK